MATIQDILAFNSYRGDANLGGGNFGVIRLDPKPLEDLARYTLMYNKSEYDQRAKDTQDKIDELAKLTALDPNSAIKKDRDYLIPKYNEVLKYGSEYARKTPKNNEERVSQFLEYKQKMSDLSKDITSGSGRSITYLKRKDDIAKDATLSPEQKELKYKQLEEEANSTDIHTAINSEEKFDLKQPDIPKGLKRKTTVLVNTGNTQVEENFTMFDPQQTLNAAFLVASGIDDKVIPKGSVAYQALTPLQKQYQDQLQLSTKSNATIWKNSAEALNTAINSKDDQGKPLYRKQDGSIDYDAIESSNPMLHGIVGLIDRWNDYVSQKRNEISQGIFSDRMGRHVTLKEAANPRDYFIIDKNKPVTPEQLVFLQMFAKSDSDDLEKNAKYTGEENTRLNNEQDNALGWYNARTGRINAEKAAATPIDPSQFGNIIDDVNADELRSEGQARRLTDPKGNPLRMVNGVVVDKDGNPFTTGKGTFVIPASALGDVVLTEYNKAAGAPKMQSDGTIVADASPSRIDTDDNGNVTIRIDGGQIVGVKTNNGTFVDRNQFADITQKGALKGVTKYKPKTNLGKYDKNAPPDAPASTTTTPADLRSKYNY